MEADTTKCLGLVVQYNQLNVADGALNRADNVVIRRENIIENRRGYASYSAIATEPAQLMVFLTKVLAHQGTTISYDNGSGTFSDYSGSFTAPSGRKMRFQEANSNLYFTTTSGVKCVMDVNAPLVTTGDISSGTNTILNVVSTTNVVPGKVVSGTGIPSSPATTVASVSGTTVTMSANATGTTVGLSITFSSVARLAGAPRALDPSFVLAGSSGFLANNTQASYRVVVERIDQNSNVLFGYPSQRMWVPNTAGGARNVTLTVYLPSEVVAGDIIQTYRTQQVSYSANGVDGTSDEMNLVNQYTLLQSDILTGNISFTDVLIDSIALTNASLYTSPSQEGIGQASARPPLCKDIALYKSNIMFYANTQSKQALNFTLVSSIALGTQQQGDVSGSSVTVTLSAANANIKIGMKVTDATTGSGIAANTTVSNIVGTTLTLNQASTGTGGATDILQFISPYTMTLAGTTYTFVPGISTVSTTATSEDATTGKIGVSTTGVVANDIDTTARSMVRVINRYATNTSVYAYYVSGSQGLPGQIYIEERVVGGSAYTIQVSNAAIAGQFFPLAPVSPATLSASTSSNSVQKNALYFSKIQQPEAVPLLNSVLVGPANTNILRIEALRDSLIIIKEEGIYRLTGETPQSFSVIPLDLTVFCKAVESVATLTNQVFMLANQGVVAISDTGVAVVSRDIEPKILPLLTFSSLATYTFGASYESERSYFLSTMTNSSDTSETQIYVYNVFTKAWTRWTFGMGTAIVESNADFLYFTVPGNLVVYRERKAFTNFDYADPEYSITITSVSGNTVNFSLSGASPIAGWVISKGGTNIKILTLTANGSNWTAVMASTPPAVWTTGSATIFPSIQAVTEWAAWTAGQPGLLKIMRFFKVFTDNIGTNDTISSLIATFRTDLDNTQEQVEIFSSSSGWGSPWGSFPWGGMSESFNYPLWTPRGKAYFRVLNTGFKHQNAQEKISVSGCGRTFELVSERSNK